MAHALLEDLVTEETLLLILSLGHKVPPSARARGIHAGRGRAGLARACVHSTWKLEESFLFTDRSTVRK